MDDGINESLGSNQDETMRIETNTAKLLQLAQQILHLKKYISANFFT